ncbi:MAG: DUF4942 domain-containing protein [Gammaproteobacteria bacterium]|nr:DUF4942 domain-containing protein [Gammaproteobacteria bacterium]
MFNADFYPTPPEVIDQMLYGLDLQNKVVLEPSAGKGDIVDACIGSGAAMVVACERDTNLRKILQSKCKVIADDFMTVSADQVSHIHAIVMNPPFSADEHHILHAWQIAPEGCDIVALCNAQTLANSYTAARKQLSLIVRENGTVVDLGECFSTAERSTYVKVSLIRLRKPGEGNECEFNGFFMEEEPEQQGNGIMQYNVVRDLVNRYVAAVKLYDSQLQLGVQMNGLISSFFSSKMAFMCTADKAPVNRNDFKKELQKSAWAWVFDKMNMQKYATSGLKKDINKFVEQQEHIPFTMRNIYRMLEIVAGTHSSRMDRAIIEVFDKLTTHYHENRYQVEGWKTNSHYLVNKKFIMPYFAEHTVAGNVSARWKSPSVDLIDDMVKALCFLTGTRYEDTLRTFDRFTERCFIKINGKYQKDEHHHGPKAYTYATVDEAANKLRSNGETDVVVVDGMTWGRWAEWDFFTVKVFHKGTAHFVFKDVSVWALFNQHVARIKGYPLPESVKKNVKK